MGHKDFHLATQKSYITFLNHKFIVSAFMEFRSAGHTKDGENRIQTEIKFGICNHNTGHLEVLLKFD